MSKLITRVALLGLVVALALPATAAAQTSIFLGGLVTVPTSDFSDFDGDGPGDEGAKTGWQATGGVGFGLGSGASIYVRGFYGQNSHDTDGDKTNPYGATAGLTYQFGSGDGPAPFIGAGAGLLVHDFTSDTVEGDSETEFAWEGMVGLRIPVGGNRLSLAGMYNGTDGTQHFGFGAVYAIVVG